MKICKECREVKEYSEFYSQKKNRDGLMDIISKKEAKENGFSFYFTGKVCRNGGVAPRRVSNNQCTCENCKKIKSEREVEYRQRPEVKERHRIQGLVCRILRTKQARVCQAL